MWGCRLCSLSLKTRFSSFLFLEHQKLHTSNAGTRWQQVSEQQTRRVGKDFSKLHNKGRNRTCWWACQVQSKAAVDSSRSEFNWKQEGISQMIETSQAPNANLWSFSGTLSRILRIATDELKDSEQSQRNINDFDIISNDKLSVGATLIHKILWNCFPDDKVMNETIKD